jgi:hypothetical protein
MKLITLHPAVPDRTFEAPYIQLDVNDGNAHLSLFDDALHQIGGAIYASGVWAFSEVEEAPDEIIVERIRKRERDPGRNTGMYT